MSNVFFNFITSNIVFKSIVVIAIKSLNIKTAITFIYIKNNNIINKLKNIIFKINIAFFFFFILISFIGRHLVLKRKSKIIIKCIFYYFIKKVNML